MVMEEYSVTCGCGITHYTISMELDPEDSKIPRKITVRCNRCGRIRYLMEDRGEDLWYIYDRSPFT